MTHVLAHMCHAATR